MAKRKASEPLNKEPTANGRDAKHPSRVSPIRLEHQRVLRCRVGRKTVLPCTVDVNRNLNRGSLAEKENVSSVADIVKCAEIRPQLKSSNSPIQRVLRSCSLRGIEQAKRLEAINCTGKQSKISTEMREEVKNGGHKESIRRKRNTQVISPALFSSTIAHDDNITFLKPMNVPFCSTPMTMPDVVVTNISHKSFVQLKGQIQGSSPISVSSPITYGKTMTTSNPLKAPLTKSTQLADIPFRSTPMKNFPNSTDELPTDKKVASVFPRLVLSPIRIEMLPQTRSRVKCDKPTEFLKGTEVHDDLASRDCPPKIPNKYTAERDALFKTKPIAKSKLRAKRKAPLKEKVSDPELDVLDSFVTDKEGKSQFIESDQKYTRISKPTDRSTSGTYSVDSGSGEYDPLKLFILHDPITMNDMPDPRTSKFRICEMQVDGFDDLGLPHSPKKFAKTTKKLAAKKEKVECVDKVNDWLQEIQDLNQEFSDIENTELCIE